MCIRRFKQGYIVLSYPGLGIGREVFIAPVFVKYKIMDKSRCNISNDMDKALNKWIGEEYSSVLVQGQEFGVCMAESDDSWTNPKCFVGLLNYVIL